MSAIHWSVEALGTRSAHGLLIGPRPIAATSATSATSVILALGTQLTFGRPCLVLVLPGAAALTCGTVIVTMHTILTRGTRRTRCHPFLVACVPKGALGAGLAALAAPVFANGTRIAVNYARRIYIIQICPSRASRAYY